jgi:hypothetical protein
MYVRRYLIHTTDDRRRRYVFPTHKLSSVSQATGQKTDGVAYNPSAQMSHSQNLVRNPFNRVEFFLYSVFHNSSRFPLISLITAFCYLSEKTTCGMRCSTVHHHQSLTVTVGSNRHGNIFLTTAHFRTWPSQVMRLNVWLVVREVNKYKSEQSTACRATDILSAKRKEMFIRSTRR